MNKKFVNAPGINLMKPEQLVEKYMSSKGLITNKSKTTVPITSPNSKVDSTVNIKQFKVCNYKNHDNVNCCLGNLCASYYAKENYLIDGYGEQMSRNNNQNIEHYINVITDMITLYYDKNDPDTSSLWSTDLNRNIFSVKMQTNDKNRFVKDRNGIQVDKYPIKLLIKFIVDMLNKYKTVIYKSQKIYVTKFIKLTTNEAIKFEKECKIKGIRLKTSDPRAKDLIDEQSCIIYNSRVISSRESKKLNQIISDINDNYANKITIIENIKEVMQTEKFATSIKKKLAKHYHITTSQLKMLFENDLNDLNGFDDENIDQICDNNKKCDMMDYADCTDSDDENEVYEMYDS